MPLAPEFEATRRPTSGTEPLEDHAPGQRSASAGSPTASFAATRPQPRVGGRAGHDDDVRAAAVVLDRPGGDEDDPREERWSLFLGAAHENDRHLFRVDLRAPEAPPVDLTPLPPGSRVHTVDALVRVPGTVLVTVDGRPGHLDHVLVEVATGRTTDDLPAGPRV